jgi:hypothetical protein
MHQISTTNFDHGEITGMDVVVNNAMLYSSMTKSVYNFHDANKGISMSMLPAHALNGSAQFNFDHKKGLQIETRSTGALLSMGFKKLGSKLRGQEASEIVNTISKRREVEDLLETGDRYEDAVSDEEEEDVNPPPRYAEGPAPPATYASARGDLVSDNQRATREHPRNLRVSTETGMLPAPTGPISGRNISLDF